MAKVKPITHGQIWKWIGGILDVAQGLVAVVTFALCRPSWTYEYWLWRCRAEFHKSEGEYHSRGVKLDETRKHTDRKSSQATDRTIFSDSDCDLRQLRKGYHNEETDTDSSGQADQTRERESG